MIVAVVIITFLLLSIPLFPAIREWRRKSDAQPLTIAQTYAEDLNAAAHRFGREVRTALSQAISAYKRPDDAGDLGPSISESFDVFRGAEAAVELSIPGRAAIVTAIEKQNLPPHLSAMRPFYVAGSLDTGSNSRFESIYVDGSLHVGEESRVRQWVHADRRLTVNAGCDLHGSASAGEVLTVFPGCRFERLQAPDIQFGDDWHWSGSWAPSDARDHSRPVLRLMDRRMRLGMSSLISGDLTISANHLFEGDLVVRGNLRVGRGAVIRGHIKTHGDLVLGHGARVFGSVFAGGSIRVGQGVRVGGVVSAERALRVEWGTVLGSPDGPATVSGRHLLIDQGVRVHGTVLAIEAGRVAFRTTARQAA